MSRLLEMLEPFGMAVTAILSTAAFGFAIFRIGRFLKVLLLPAGVAVGPAGRRFSRCGHCGYVLYRDPLQCPECGTATGAELRRRVRELARRTPKSAVSMRRPEPGESIVLVHETDHWPVAKLVRLHLITRGIPMPDRPPDTSDPFQPGFRKYRIHVYSGDECVALEVVGKLLSELGDPEDD